ncbi:hypothetical protein OUZ56_000880 [Daphnia magna]|uniref:Uncharacterized protein n=1 Tax=Daphnia magna TaxID=35525 RepID=A0ABR0A110_9CRUS|nr:hypothetical protein OUZ56_000880 [Daphnia magna]
MAVIQSHDFAYSDWLYLTLGVIQSSTLTPSAWPPWRVIFYSSPLLFCLRSLLSDPHSFKWEQLLIVDCICRICKEKDITRDEEKTNERRVMEEGHRSCDWNVHT